MHKTLTDKIMRTTAGLLKSLLILLLFLITSGLWAQENTNPTQTVCVGTQHYRVIPGNASGNTFLWSVSGGTTGVDWTIGTPSGYETDIVWKTSNIYTVKLSETDGTTDCEKIVTVVVTVSASPGAPVSGGNVVQCEQSPIQTLTASATPPSGSTVVWYDAATGGNVVASPVWNTVGTVKYYAESVDDASGCTSLTRTAVTLTINPMPATSPIWHN